MASEVTQKAFKIQKLRTELAGSRMGKGTTERVIILIEIKWPQAEMKSNNRVPMAAQKMH